MKKEKSVVGRLIVLACVFCMALGSCMDEKFSSNPSHRLSFSTDTIFFDTIFSTVASSTKLMKVYNRNSESLMFSVRLADKSNSGFRMNVDGQNDIGVTEFAGLSIRGNDSLYIWVELTAKLQNSGETGLIKDSLVFTSNGVSQDVKLVAYGRDANMLHAPVITEDTVFTDYRPIIIYDSLVVAEGATLTCEAGTSLYFHGNSECIVRGKIVTKGENGREVVFRGDRTDRLFPYLPYDRVPGQWGGVRICSESYENSFDYTDIHGGVFGILCDSADVTRQKITVTNSKITNTTGNNLQMTNCKAYIGNTEISNAGGSCVDMTGGDVRFIHCTLANYYAYGLKTGSALSLRNVKDNISYPVIDASFFNCIIAGSSRDEISGSMSDDGNIPYNYAFRYSLVNSVQPEEGDVVECLWEKDDRFLKIDNENFIYDFRPDTLSKAINAGSLEYSNDFPYDRMGNPRMIDAGGDGMPDAGCYEWKN